MAPTFPPPSPFLPSDRASMSSRLGWPEHRRCGAVTDQCPGAAQAWARRRVTLHWVRSRPGSGAHRARLTPQSFHHTGRTAAAARAGPSSAEPGPPELAGRGLARPRGAALQRSRGCGHGSAGPSLPARAPAQLGLPKAALEQLHSHLGARSSARPQLVTLRPRFCLSCR